MVQLIVVLLVLGLVLYLVTLLPIDPVILRIVQVVVLLCVILWLLSAFGILDAPLPRVR
jgi:hypothetical protein